jgi:hypothetical protein
VVSAERVVAPAETTTSFRQTRSRTTVVSTALRRCVLVLLVDEERRSPIVVDTRRVRWDPRCRGHPIKEDPVLTESELHRHGKLRDMWGRWRQHRRQYQIERAVFKAAGGNKQFEHHRDGDLSRLKGDGGAGTGIGTGM